MLQAILEPAAVDCIDRLSDEEVVSPKHAHTASSDAHLRADRTNRTMEIADAASAMPHALSGSAGAMYFNKFHLVALPGRLPEEPSPSDVVAQHISDLRLLDSNPRLNLASFVTTWMEPPARQLIMDALAVNAADGTIYPSSKDIENKCLTILADLFHAPNASHPVGCATVGSTEACLLGGLNMKKRWQDRRKGKGLPTDKPNLVVCYSYQICWEKFCRYWDVEMRCGHLSEGSYVLRPEDLEALADENTIGVVAILGSTYTGDLEDVAALGKMCDKLKAERGLELPIHVDAASGGLVIPFLFPDLVWDFQVPNVLSIAVSGHKFGLVYPGIGWAVFRDEATLHQDLVFHLTYLGAEETSISLNFSRSASHIVAQYYQFLRLGRQGFTLVSQSMHKVACHVAEGLKDSGVFEVLNDPHKCIPLVAFRLKPYYEPGQQPSSKLTGGGTDADQAQSDMGRPYTEFELVEKMKGSGWSIPAYKLAPDLNHIIICRVVIREDFSLSLAGSLLQALFESVKSLDEHFAGRSREEAEQRRARTMKPCAKHHIVC